MVIWLCRVQLLSGIRGHYVFKPLKPNDNHFIIESRSLFQFEYWKGGGMEGQCALQLAEKHVRKKKCLAKRKMS